MSRYTISRGLFRQRFVWPTSSGLAPFLGIDIKDNSETQIDRDTGTKIVDSSHQFWGSYVQTYAAIVPNSENMPIEHAISPGTYTGHCSSADSTFVTYSMKESDPCRIVSNFQDHHT
jgi:hypothetical protein